MQGMDNRNVNIRVISWWSILFLWLLPSGVHAENPALQRAVSAYESFEYQEALRYLEQALPVETSTVEEKAKVHLYLGLVRFTLGDRKAADSEFFEALKLDYEIKLPPDISPKISTRFINIKKIVPPPEKKPDDPGNQTTVTVINPPVISPPVIVKKSLPQKPRKRIWTWIVGGVGVAALAGGGTFGLLASSAKSDFDKAQWAADADKIKSTIESRSLTANVLFGIGGAALVASLILLLVEDSSGASDEATGSKIGVVPGPMGLGVGFSF
jgi:hypothetical protein